MPTFVKGFPCEYMIDSVENCIFLAGILGFVNQPLGPIFHITQDLVQQDLTQRRRLDRRTLWRQNLLGILAIEGQKHHPKN